ncbi:MAG TPA: hypothetical protein VIK89_00825 [Cytophagaceae bacterium]
MIRLSIYFIYIVILSTITVTAQDIKTYVYDKKGRLIQRNRVNFYGKLEADSKGVAFIKYEYDKKGYLEKKSYYGIDGQLYRPDTTSAIREIPSYCYFRYDKAYNLTEYSNHYANGNLMELTYKPAIKLYKYNQFNQLIEEINLNKYGKLTGVGSMEVAIIKYSYAKNKVVDEISYDVNNKVLDFGINVVKHVYNNQNRREKTNYYYASSDLFQTDRFTYNTSGKLIKHESFKKNGKLDYTIKQSYENGRLVKREYIYSNGEHKEEVHGIELKVTGWKMVTIPSLDGIDDVNGMATFKVTIDKKGNLLSAKSLDYVKPAFLYACYPLLRQIKLERDQNVAEVEYFGEVVIGILNENRYVEEF